MTALLASRAADGITFLRKLLLLGSAGTNLEGSPGTICGPFGITFVAAVPQLLTEK